MQRDASSAWAKARFCSVIIIRAFNSIGDHVMNASAAKSLPIHRITKGAVQVAIWANEVDSGVRFSVTLDRSYRTADGAWRSTASLDRDALLIAAEALREASQWIYAEEFRRREERHSLREENSSQASPATEPTF